MSLRRPPSGSSIVTTAHSQELPRPNPESPAAGRGGGPFSGRQSRSVVGFRLLPIQHIPKRRHIVGPHVLVLEVVGVLPYVQADDRRRATSSGAAVDRTVPTDSQNTRNVDERGGRRFETWSWDVPRSLAAGSDRDQRTRLIMALAHQIVEFSVNWLAGYAARGSLFDGAVG